MANDEQALSGEPAESTSGIALPEPLRKGLITAIVALLLSAVVFVVVSGTEGLLPVIFAGFATTTVLFTTVYVLA